MSLLYCIRFSSFLLMSLALTEAAETVRSSKLIDYTAQRSRVPGTLGQKGPCFGGVRRYRPVPSVRLLSQRSSGVT